MDRRRFVQFGVGAAATLLVPEFRPSLWALDQTMIRPNQNKTIIVPDFPLVEDELWGSVEYQVNAWHISDEGIIVIDDAKVVGVSLRPVRYDMYATMKELEPDQAWITSNVIDVTLL